jgi:hypothetical protein
VVEALSETSQQALCTDSPRHNDSAFQTFAETSVSKIMRRDLSSHIHIVEYEVHTSLTTCYPDHTPTYTWKLTIMFF